MLFATAWQPPGLPAGSSNCLPEAPHPASWKVELPKEIISRHFHHAMWPGDEMVDCYFVVAWPSVLFNTVMLLIRWLPTANMLCQWKESHIRQISSYMVQLHVSCFQHGISRSKLWQPLVIKCPRPRAMLQAVEVPSEKIGKQHFLSWLWLSRKLGWIGKSRMRNCLSSFLNPSNLWTPSAWLLNHEPCPRCLWIVHPKALLCRH